MKGRREHRVPHIEGAEARELDAIVLGRERGLTSPLHSTAVSSRLIESTFGEVRQSPEGGIAKLYVAMSVEEFDDNYFYAAELKTFAGQLGIAVGPTAEA